MASQRKNIAGLLAHAKQRRILTLSKAEDALRVVEREEIPVSFQNVAQAAGVSVAWLYRQPEIKARIKRMAARQRKAGREQDMNVNELKSLIGRQEQIIAKLEEEKRLLLRELSQLKQ